MDADPAATANEFVEVTYTVEPNYAGWRLDRYLCEKIRRLSRARVQHIIHNSLISPLASERKFKPSTRVTSGMTFQLRRRRNQEPDTPRDVPTLYEDADLLVLDKPAGLPVHPSARYHHGTLTALLKERLGPDAIADPAHRLDRETSGVIVCGRSTEVSRRLSKAFMRGEVHKAYVGICEGWPAADAFEVDAAIAEGRSTVRIAVRIDAAVGKPAQTRFVVERRFLREGERFALLRAFPLTGRQHQIRVHLQHAGYSLVGDKIYGPDEGYFDRFSKNSLEPEAWVRLRLPRHALHAAELSLHHPMSGEAMTFQAPLPRDLADFTGEGDVVKVSAA